MPVLRRTIGVYIDNSLNGSAFTLTVAGTNMNVTARANSQGWYPLFCPNPPRFTFASSGGVNVPVFFGNMPMPSATWDTIPEDASNLTAEAPDNFSIVVGGTAQNVFAAGEIENSAIITNPFSASESLFVDLVNAAQTSAPGTNGTTFELEAGDTFFVPGPMVKPVSVNAVTTAHEFSATRV
jgi:hypothetical protein